MMQDIGVGLMLGVVANIVTGDDQRDAVNITFGVVSALVPDIDYLIYRYRNPKSDRFDYKHRELLHHPLPFSVGGAIVISFFNIIFGVMWFCGTLYHFIHDTYTAWGIRWGSPFFEWYIVFRSDYSKRIVPNKEELERIVEKLGDDNYAENENLKFTWELVVKLVILNAGVFVAFSLPIFWITVYTVPLCIGLLGWWKRNKRSAI